MQLAFPLTTYHARVARVRETARAQGLDAVVVTLPDAIHWLTGFDTIGYLWSQALVVDHADGEPVLHTRTTEQPGVEATTWLTAPKLYDIATEDPTEGLAATLRERGHAAGRVGIDLRSFAFLPAQWEQIKRLLPEVEWVDTTDLVAELRLVKTQRELAYQREAAAIADAAMHATLQALRPGISEVELAGVAAAALGAAGSEYAAIPPMVVSGPRTGMVHAMASRRVIGHGDVVCVELGAAVHRYHAIVMRTAVVGVAPPRVRDVHDCARRGLEAAFAAAGPGAPAHAPDDACNAVLAELDLVRRRCHRIGYSIGVAYPPGWLEPMMLVAGDPHVLGPGMSFSLEPNLTLADEGFGIKIGETVVCTEGGAERLSAVDLALTEVV